MAQLLSVTLLLTVLIVMRYFLRGRIHPTLQYALWLLAAVRLLTPFSVGCSPLSIHNITIQPSTTYTTPTVTAQKQPDAAPLLSSQQGATPPSSETGSNLNGAIKSDLGENAPPTSHDTLITPRQVLRGVWFLGAVAMGLCFSLQNLVLYRRLRRSRTRLDLPQSQRIVYHTDRLPGPCLFGLVHPAIYLTPSCSRTPYSIPYILAHEETHYRHGDHIWSFVRCLCLALYWFHPLVWWAAVLSRTDCELACDQGTLARLWKEHRRDYGNTLIQLAAGWGKPTGLLCGATTMTSSQSKLKERIVMLTNQPKMLLRTLCIITLILVVTVGCTFTGSQAKEASIPLTPEELAFFNGDEFFNGSYFNVRNQFLNSLYGNPKDINLFALFCDGNGLQESRAAGELPPACNQEGLGRAADGLPYSKNSRANMDVILRENVGLTLAEMKGVGLDSFQYLSEYDAYYSFPKSSNYRTHVTFHAGERQGDLILLYYEDEFLVDGEKVLTLQAVETGYHFVSNQYAVYTPEGSLVQPEGIVPTGLSVPDSVLTAAQSFVREQYTYRLYQTGIWETVDNAIQMAGTLPVLDNWRMEGLEQVQTIPLPDALTLLVYRVDYRLHTTTPEKVVLTDGMDLTEDGWWLDNDGTYLVFTVMGEGEPIFQFATTRNDCNPGDQRFTDEILTAYEEHTALPGDGNGAWKVARDLFQPFSEGRYDAMQAYCTPSCIELYFHDGDVFGMEKADCVALRTVSKTHHEAASLAENESAVFVTVSMKAAPTSAHYDPTQETQETSFYLILQRQANGAYLVDRFVTGL